MVDVVRGEDRVIVVQRSGSLAGILVAIAFLIAVLGLLEYYGMLPF